MQMTFRYLRMPGQTKPRARRFDKLRQDEQTLSNLGFDSSRISTSSLSFSHLVAGFFPVCAGWAFIPLAGTYRAICHALFRSEMA